MKYYLMEWDISTSNWELIKICDTKEEAKELSCAEPFRYYYESGEEELYGMGTKKIDHLDLMVQANKFLPIQFLDITTNLLPKTTKK